MNAAREIDVWCCPLCDYWRKDETSGIHKAENPDNPHGWLVEHELERVTFRCLSAGQKEQQNG